MENVEIKPKSSSNVSVPIISTKNLGSDIKILE